MTNPTNSQPPAVSAITPVDTIGKLKRYIAQFRSLGGIPEMCDLAWKLCCENEELKAEVERLRAALLSSDRAVQWRPIQTAPKDRRIVVWLESDRKGLVCWNEKAQRWLEYGMGFCDPLYWFDVPAPDLDDAGETHDTVLS